MNIGIIVHSQTGNTHSVGRKLQEKLEQQGHSVTVELLDTANDEVGGSGGEPDLGGLFDIDRYDALVFGSPVQAFSLAPVMTVYLSQLPSLDNMDIACFVTKQLPFYWTGGNRAIAAMKRICEEKGGRVVGTEVVFWSRREKSIRDCVENLSLLFQT